MPSMKPLSLVVTEKLTLSAETEHFDHAHTDADAHWGYCISPPLLRKGTLKITSHHSIHHRLVRKLRYIYMQL